MRLLDHFQPPVSNRKGWTGIHSQWAVEIVRHLNRSVLPTRYESEPYIRSGTAVEDDVGTFDREDRPRVYAPPEPALYGAVSLAEADTFEIQVWQVEGEARLVAAIELVSESNKDRPATRRTFARKCGVYLQRGVSVVVVDVVTSRRANLHTRLVDELRLPDEFDWASDSGLSAIAYRLVRRDDQQRLEVWPMPLTLGGELPTLPLWLAADLAVPLDLAATYAEVCDVLNLRRYAPTGGPGA